LRWGMRPLPNRLLIRRSYKTSLSYSRGWLTASRHCWWAYHLLQWSCFTSTCSSNCKRNPTSSHAQELRFGRPLNLNRSKSANSNISCIEIQQRVLQMLKGITKLLSPI
jgi:hypothetical protein